MLEILAGDIPLPAGEEPQPAPQFDEEATFTLRNPHGLHARPSAVLVKAVKQWRSQIRVENLDTRSAIVDAKNLMRVVSLGAKQGHRLHFMASGNDAQQALKAIGDAFKRRSRRNCRPAAAGLPGSRQNETQLAIPNI